MNEKDERIKALEKQLRQAKAEIKTLQEWKTKTLNSVRALVFDFAQLPEIFAGLDDEEKIAEIMKQLKDSAFPFQNVK